MGSHDRDIARPAGPQGQIGDAVEVLRFDAEKREVHGVIGQQVAQNGDHRISSS